MANLVEKARLGRMAALEGKMRGMPHSTATRSHQKFAFVSSRTNPGATASWPV